LHNASTTNLFQPFSPATKDVIKDEAPQKLNKRSKTFAQHITI
jgi:hypothetical protein